MLASLGVTAERDIPLERDARYLEGIRKLSPAQRGALLDGMVADARRLLEAGVRHREPTLNDAQVRWRMWQLLHGEAAAQRVLGPWPR